MTLTFRHIPSSVSATGDARPLSPVADATNVIPLIAATVVPQIAALIDEERDLCAGCGAPTWSYYPCDGCA